MSFSNLYYKRTAGTAKACFVCYKPTTTVLATINTVDFIYACDSHLSDRGFTSKVVDDASAKKAAVSTEEIEKVKKEWDEQQRKKKEKEKEKEKEKATKEKEKEDGKGKDKDKDDSSSTKDASSDTSKLPGSLSPSPAPTTPTHERYTLHRDFYAMRQAEHRKRRQVAQAKELAPKLPGAPTGSVI